VRTFGWSSSRLIRPFRPCGGGYPCSDGQKRAAATIKSASPSASASWMRKAGAPQHDDQSAQAASIGRHSDLDPRNVKTPRGWVQRYNAQAVPTADQIVIAAEVGVDSPSQRGGPRTQERPLLDTSALSRGPDCVKRRGARCGRAAGSAARFRGPHPRRRGAQRVHHCVDPPAPGGTGRAWGQARMSRAGTETQRGQPKDRA
jgi:hypothetical protein